MDSAASFEIARPIELRIAPVPKRILLKAVNWLGDLVMSLPAMRAVRRAFPEAHLAVLIKKELASFFDGADWLGEVIPYSVGAGLSGLNDCRKIVGEIRSHHFDLAVLMPSSFESALWVTAAGIPAPRRIRSRRARRDCSPTRPRPDRGAIDGHQVRLLAGDDSRHARHGR